MSTLKPSGRDAAVGDDETSAAHRPQLCPPVSTNDVGAAPASAAPGPEANGERNPGQTKDEDDGQEKEEETKKQSGSSTVELRQEIDCLEEVINKLEEEKNALKMRLNEIEYFQKFQVGHCKKWLQANFDFDRKDTPDLLAGIFEDYLMQNVNLQPLPHQMIVKNSAKGKMRRDKLIQQRTQHRGVKRETASATNAPAPKKANKSSGTSGAEGNNVWAIYNVFIPLDEMELLYAKEPWQDLPKNWPKIIATSKNSTVQELLTAQESFLEENAWAIWERNHWFPIKQENGRTEDEIKRLCQIHSRRKRRQMFMKNSLEQTSRKMQKSVEKSVLKQSIFSAESVKALLKRPRLWIPREGEGLLPQLEELDREEPDRNVYI